MYASHPPQEEAEKASASPIAASSLTTYAIILGLVLVGSIMLVGDTSGFGGKAHLGRDSRVPSHHTTRV